MGVDKYLVDTQATVLDGMNSGRQPELIAESQVALLRNVSIRGGRARSRPRIIERLDLPAGKIQGASVFKSISRLMVSIDGKVLEVDPRIWEYQEKTGWINESELTLDADPKAALRDSRRNSPSRPRHFYCETAGSIVIQDDQSLPLIYDGSTIRRSGHDAYDTELKDATDNPLSEVPVGGAMAYGNGRLAVAVNRTNVRLGDIRQPEHQSELKFYETYNLLGGGDFAFPSPVTSLAILPVVDTGSGQGSLIVGQTDRVSTLKTQITQRDLWADIGLSTILLPTRGVTGPGALVAVNQDLYFRSSDGLRSIRTSTADYDAPGLAPLSVEVRHRLDYDTPFLLADAQVAYFDNRLLFTHSPFVYSNRSMAQGLISYNFDAISGRGEKSPPAFDGEWDGILIASIAVGVIDGTERCFIIGRSAAGANKLYEVLPEVSVSTAESTTTQVFESKFLNGQVTGGLRHLRRADIRFSGIRGALNVRVYFRGAECPFWIKWSNWSVPAPTNKPAWGQPRPQHRSPFQTTTPREDIDPVTSLPVSVSTGFQVRVEWDGIARLDTLQVAQEPIPMSVYAQNRDSQASAVIWRAPSYAYDPRFWYLHPVSPLAGIN